MKSFATLLLLLAGTAHAGDHWCGLPGAHPLDAAHAVAMEASVPSPEEVWAALNADNKVSIYANVNGEVKLFNKNSGD